jgi:MAPEG family protein
MRVSQFLIVVPALVQVMLTLVLFVPSWRERLGRGPAGPSGGRYTDVYRAQFELPVLFYAAALFAYAMRLVDPWLLFLAVLFVLAQIVEAVSALAFGNRSARSVAVCVAALAALGMWVNIAAHFAVAGF